MEPPCRTSQDDASAIRYRGIIFTTADQVGVGGGVKTHQTQQHGRLISGGEGRDSATRLSLTASAAPSRPISRTPAVAAALLRAKPQTGSLEGEAV